MEDYFGRGKMELCNCGYPKYSYLCMQQYHSNGGPEPVKEAAKEKTYDQFNQEWPIPQRNGCKTEREEAEIRQRQDPPITPQEYIRFLDQLLEYMGNEIFWILENEFQQ